MAETRIEGAKPTSIAQVSWAVNDIDKVVESWSKLYGFGPWTYSENGGVDAKGRPWKIRMAFAYVGPLQIELVQCTGAGSSSPAFWIPGEKACTISAGM